MRDIPLPDRIDVDHVVANSFRDFHVKGFDYICLRRSPVETIKLYFFDGDVARLPEVVNPHDHRYPFDTKVLCGASENIIFIKSPLGEAYAQFDYHTPLNGGDGFTYVCEERLKLMSRCRYGAGKSYAMEAHELHTIRIVENETVLLLRQREDVVPRDRPTTTFTRDHSVPSLEGLYRRFTADLVLDRLRSLEERTGIRFEMETTNA